MLAFAIINIVVIFTNKVMSIDATSQQSPHYKKNDGYKFIGQPISEVEGKTKLTCTAKCDLEINCLGINFIVENGSFSTKCQLFDFPRTEENVIKDDSSTLIEKIKLDDNLLAQEIILIGLPCDQIDTYESQNQVGFNCTLAINGKYELSCSSSFIVCSHTSSLSNAWWQVDYGRQYTTTKVLLYNRDQYKENLDNFTIRLQDQPMPTNPNSNKSCVKDIPFADKQIRTLVCDQPVTGRYLVVQLVDRILVLVEVRAFGYPHLQIGCQT